MFEPLRCPNRDCSAHAIERHPELHTVFFVRKGFYHPKCRAHPVPRFRCRLCGRGFSRQTFRQDYRDHKPHLNARLFELLAHGLGLRQSAMILKLSRRCTEMKARKLSAHLQRLNRNLLDQLPEGCSFQLDEMETFEDERTVCPVTLPILIEQESMLVLAAESAPIRPSGRMNKRRRNAIARREKAAGRRQDASRACVKRVLRHAAKYCRHLCSIRLDSDEKSTYPKLARQAFGRRLEHRRYSSTLPRDTTNPLFPINHTNAMARYLLGRLRRRSWLASKRRRYLDLQLQVFQAFRNWVRPRFNTDKETPGMLLGLVGRRMGPTDVLSWRQDWGWFSPHPLHGGASIRAVRAGQRSRGMASFQHPVTKRGYAD